MPGPRAPEEARREQILNAAYAVARRTGLDAVTLRAVAAEASLSHGLVVFYFKQKDQLIAALLDRVLATAALLHVSEELARLPRASDRLRALLRQELERLADDPSAFRLFLEYWALGARQPTVRAKIAAALERYRSALRTVAEGMLRAAPARRNVVTADGVAAVAVSLISGCAMQAMIDPEAFDVDGYAAAVKGLVAQLEAPAAEDVGAAHDAPESNAGTRAASRRGTTRGVLQGGGR